jgi:hypothetical protein
LVEKSQFSKIYIYIKKEKKKDWAGLILAQPQGWTQPSRVGWADVPACRKQGWTQPSRAGWADVPAH